MCSGSLEVVGFIRVCPGGRLIHSEALGLFGCTLGSLVYWQSLDSLGVIGFIRVRSGVCRIHSVSFDSSVCAHGVV